MAEISHGREHEDWAEKPCSTTPSEEEAEVPVSQDDCLYALQSISSAFDTLRSCTAAFNVTGISQPVREGPSPERAWSEHGQSGERVSLNLRARTLHPEPDPPDAG